MKSIGTDIVEIEKISYYSKKDYFMNKIFTKKEMEYFERKKDASHIGTTFAAKEAVFKAMGTGWTDGKEVEILRNKAGKPYVKLYGGLKNKLKGKEIMLSMSFTKDYAVAFAAIF